MRLNAKTCASLLQTILATAGSAAPKPSPNIVYILADDLGYVRWQMCNVDAVPQGRI